VTGLSGEGKSSLVEKFLQPIRKSKEMLVLSGRCYDRESVPFKAVDAVIEALVRYLRSCPDATVSRLISDDVSVLTQLFPALQRVPEITRRVTASKVRFDERQVRHRAFFALRAILKQIGQKTPVVIFLDDLQWGDADSAEALFDILAPPESPSIMLVGTYRSDEVADSTFVQDWRELGERRGKVGTETTVEVEPLSREELGELMAGHFDVESASAMKQLDATYEETKGNPYFVSQLVERFDSQTTQIERLGLVSFTRMLQDKLSLLPAISGDILRVIAIAGQSLPVDDIARVLTTKSPVLSALAHMRSERLVRLIGSNDYQQIDTYHDKIREIVLEGLSESQRQDLHSRFGEMLESEIPSFDSLLEYLERDAARTEDAPESPERLYDLAYHFNASKNERSFTYQLMAGEQAYRAFSGDDAVAFLQRANATLPGNASVAIRYRLWERLATSLARCRKFEDSLEYFDRALRVAPSGLARATVFSGIAAVYQSLGNYSEATNNYDQAIEELGAPRPPKATQAIRLTLMIGRVFATPWRRPASGKRLCSQEHKLELDVYSNLVPYLFEHAESVFEYPFASFRLGKLSMKSGDSGRAAFGLGLFAAQVACNGAGRRGAKILEIAKRIDDQSMDLASRAMYKFSAAVVNQNTCQLQQSDQEFEASIPQLASTGHHMHASVGAHLHRHLLQVIGSSNREIEAANRVVRLGEETGDLRGQCWGHYDLASGLARRGELRESFQQIEEARQFLDAGQMNLTETIFLSTHGYCLLQASEYAAARPILEQSYRLLKARKIIMEYTSRCVPLLIESICGSNWLSGGTQKDHRYLKHLCRVAWLIDRVYPNIQSPVRRLRGRAFCLMGKKRRAIRCLESAVASAKSLGADHDQARSLLDLAAFQQLECDHLRTHAIALLKKTESVIPRAESWLLGDQYDEAVVAPEFDLETWEREYGPIDRTEQT
jgi:tetratricopeptide (TPR) repeat protein